MWLLLELPVGSVLFRLWVVKLRNSPSNPMDLEFTLYEEPSPYENDTCAYDIMVWKHMSKFIDRFVTIVRNWRARIKLECLITCMFFEHR